MVKLSKIPFKNLEYLLAALKFQDIAFATAYDTLPSHELKFNWSICKKMYNEFYKKVDKEFPPQSTSIVLHYFEAFMLVAALNNYQLQLSKTSHEYNVALQLKNQILQFPIMQ